MPKIKRTVKVTPRGAPRRASTTGKGTTVKTGKKPRSIIRKRKVG